MSTHPIARFAHAVDDALDKVLGASTIGMTASEEADALVTLARLEGRLVALRMKVMAGASRVCEDGAHRTVADYLAHVTHADRSPLAAAERLAHELELWVVLAAAVASGSVSVAKATVIANALRALASENGVTADLLLAAEQHLVSIAPDFTASQLRRLSKHVLSVVAPELEEDAEARALLAEERRALESMTLTLRHRPDGLEGITEIHGRIPTGSAVRLKTYLEAYTSPRHAPDDPTSVEEPRSGVAKSRQLALAFCSMLEALDPSRLPIHGGTATTVMVTIDYQALKKDLAAAGLTGSMDGEIRITVSEARRLACTADLIPVVLGGKSEPLDLGRASRLFNPAQRKAMALRDKTCRAEGCDIPANWCEAHHYNQPWSHGGRTDLNDGRLLCRWHHHRAHDDRYLHQELPNGDVRFTRRR